MDTVISADGTPIAYQRSGKGPALVLIHGTTSDHSTTWKFVLASLEEHFTVYVMDRRGRGESGDGREYSLNREAEDVAALINSIGQFVNVLGHSYGALCAIKAALLTKNIRRLILYEGVPARGIDLYEPGIIDEMQNLIDSGKTEDALVMMFCKVVKMPENEIHLLRTQPDWKKRIANANTAAREMREEQKFVFDPTVYGKITIPTLLLVGGESPPPELSNAQAVASALTNSRIQILAGQQHAAMYTSPDLFVKVVIEFLKKERSSI